MLANERQELLAVAGLANDDEVGALEETCEPLAQKHVVIGNDDAGGDVEVRVRGRHRRKYPLASARERMR